MAPHAAAPRRPGSADAALQGADDRSRSATLLAYTLVALAPPYLAKLAIDEGIKAHDLSRLTWIVGALPRAALLALVLSAANTYLTGWTGERVLADLRNKLFAPPRSGSRSASTSATAPA